MEMLIAKAQRLSSPSTWSRLEEERQARAAQRLAVTSNQSSQAIYCEARIMPRERGYEPIDLTSLERWPG